MFSWFKTWRNRSRMKKMVAAGAIFPYWDGQRVRYGDPFKIWLALTQDEKVNLQRLLPEVDEVQPKAIYQALAHVCKVFDVTRWDEATQSGLTDLELLALLNNVLSWTNLVKKNSRPGLTSPPATPVSTSSPSPASPQPTRNSSSDSTSIASDKRPGGPTPVCEPSATPSASTTA